MTTARLLSDVLSCGRDRKVGTNFSNVYYFMQTHKDEVPAPKRIGRIDQRQVFRLHDSGMTPQRIGEVVGCSRQMVDYVLGRGRTAANGKITQAMAREWAELVKQGQTINSIAQQYKVGYNTVQRHMEWVKEQDSQETADLSDMADSRGYFDVDKYAKASRLKEWSMNRQAPVRTYRLPARSA